MTEDCLFCRIGSGEIKADIVYQDVQSLAFRDINPQAPVHFLVIPRAHVISLDDAAKLDDATLGHLMNVAARVARELGLDQDGYRTVINTGAGAGQSVFHLHLHVLGGRKMSWPPG